MGTRLFSHVAGDDQSPLRALRTTNAASALSGRASGPAAIVKRKFRRVGIAASSLHDFERIYLEVLPGQGPGYLGVDFIFRRKRRQRCVSLAVSSGIEFQKCSIAQDQAVAAPATPL